ncbi:MAG TPA: HAD family hydrolase [Aromatoleum sp.]|uniref:D-glycero-alpha-D-manno-heptose-1,7-bisphosphate 7-phosphatase n=1 Tax=Aromatoleum sp. TaxID=2307007 RepID=UPI002B47C97C|nr:HAD family hydrolase [Aromatoleum sp.]HJV24643.1 HAD family hydrolase [Aromatoleum sp.]
MALSPAVFLDKDGTLVHDVPYNADPNKVRLRDDAGPALASLQRRGYRLVLVSNQSGLARGMFQETALERIWAAMADALSPYGVALDGIYYCPHHPDGSVPEFAHRCDCRKPAPGMLLRAAEELDLDLARSWIIGDILDDIEAGRRAGCRAILLDVGSETEWRSGPYRQPDRIAASLTEATADIIASESLGATQGDTPPEAAQWPG